VLVSAARWREVSHEEVKEVCKERIIAAKRVQQNCVSERLNDARILRYSRDIVRTQPSLLTHVLVLLKDSGCNGDYLVKWHRQQLSLAY